MAIGPAGEVALPRLASVAQAWWTFARALELPDCHGDVGCSVLGVGCGFCGCCGCCGRFDCGCRGGNRNGGGFGGDYGIDRRYQWLGRYGGAVVRARKSRNCAKLPVRSDCMVLCNQSKPHLLGAGVVRPHGNGGLRLSRAGPRRPLGCSR
jgi:hypothetical protein